MASTNVQIQAKIRLRQRSRKGQDTKFRKSLLMWMINLYMINSSKNLSHCHLLYTQLEYKAVFHWFTKKILTTFLGVQHHANGVNTVMPLSTTQENAFLLPRRISVLFRLSWTPPSILQVDLNSFQVQILSQSK